MDKINIIKKNGLPLNEQDKENFRSRLAIVCFQLGFVIVVLFFDKKLLEFFK